MATKIQTSDLKCRVYIQKKVLTQDAIGGSTITYTNTGPFWAKIEQWKGRETWRAERAEGLVYQRVVVRHGVGLAIDDVVLYQGRKLPVKYLSELTEGAVKYVEALTIEGDPVGGQ